MIRSLIKFLLIVAFVVFILPIIVLFGLAIFRHSSGDNGASGSAAGAPGKIIFDDMNKEIASYHEMEAFGNTTDAQTIAQSFATAMKAIRAEAFTKGKAGAFSLSEGHFLTSCHVEQDAVVVLCHVPELRRFEDEAKASLMAIAWTVAQSAATKQDAKPHRLVVGLRGVALYYQFWFGQTAGTTVDKRDAKDGRNALYEVLAPAPTPAPPTTPAVKPTTMCRFSAALRVG